MTALLAPGSVALRHVAVPCRELEPAIRFYERLGFRRGFGKPDDRGRPVLQQMGLGDFFIELIRGADPVPGGGHIGLSVPDADRTHAQLISMGLAAEAPQTGASGVRYFFISDPDGNRIEFTS
ncbi:VOC family protein [Frigidibacter sp. ROC022]|uniref:VOC family protein n=1 Tax=Frigidibacter sp. ROC022 TaxID=2971796 RepID=UPI00215B0ADA|nr:VOC family protein [Frigidibacter sp. ROC022]MCR8724637.1 VOC family protein [Frigidibacter sp. ROC022]